MPDSQPEARMVEMEAADTLDVTPESLIEYFSVSPYSWEITEVKGKTVKHKVPNDLPTPAGFCAKMGISERTLSDLVAKDPQWQAASEIASAKMKYFIQINGITKGVWEQTFASLLAKNEIGYTEKAEVRQVGLTHEEALRELVRQELLASQPLETPLPVIEHLSEARVV